MVLSPALRALLWAALAFPGAGHLYLKHFRRGVALLAITLLSLSVSLFKFVQQATAVFEKLLDDGAVLDVSGMVGQLLQTSAADHLLTRSLWVLGFCWLFGMLDAYRLGLAE